MLPASVCPCFGLIWAVLKSQLCFQSLPPSFSEPENKHQTCKRSSHFHGCWLRDASSPPPPLFFFCLPEGVCVCIQVLKGMQSTCKFKYMHILYFVGISLALTSVQSLLILTLPTFPLGLQRLQSCGGGNLSVSNCSLGRAIFQTQR